MKVGARNWLVLVTVPDTSTQEKLTSVLLAEKLAACVSAFPVVSRYRWNGKIERTKEHQLLIKTSAPLKRLGRRIAELHPYEVPEILAFEVKKGAVEYLAWMKKESG